MAARQGHGFRNEQRIIEKYGLEDVSGYTDKWDAYAPVVVAGDKKYFNVPVQIKTIREGGSIDMGDVFRHSKTSEDFILHVDFYDKGNKRKIVESHILYIDIKRWKPFFDFEDWGFLRECLDNITNDHSDDARWGEMRNMMHKLWGDHRPIKLAPKRDHKKQKRIQCTIRNNTFKDQIVRMFQGAVYV
mgnify:FL=1